MDQHRPENPREAWAAIVFQAVAGVAAVSPLWIVLGPEPRPPVGVWLLSSGQIEWADRLWLLSWWTLPVTVWWWLRRHREMGGHLLGEWIYPVGAAMGLALLTSQDVGSALMDWPGFNPMEVLLALAAVPLVWRLGVSGRFDRILLPPAMAWMAVSLYVVYEHSGRVLGRLHVPYWLDEFLLYAAGRIPWVDYIPQYAALLGAPLWLLRDWSMPALHDATLLYVWLLSAFTLLAWLLGQWAAFGRHGAWLHVMVLATFPMLTSGWGWAPLAYHALYPMRFFFPACTFACLAGWGWCRAQGFKGDAAWGFGLGLLTALGVLNNVEFGVCNAGAVGAVVVLLGRRRSKAPLLAWLAGFATLIAAHDALWRLGVGHWPGFEVRFTFVRLFGQGGLGNISMEAWGLHTAVAAFLSLAALGAGWALWWGRREREATAIVYLAVFGLGILAYFAGRSVPASVAASSGLMAALIAAGITAKEWRHPGWLTRPRLFTAWGQRGYAWGIRLPLVALLAAAFGYHRVAQLHPVPHYILVPPAKVLENLPPGTALFTRNGNFLATTLKLPNALPFNHPEDIVGPATADCFCEKLAHSNTTHLLIEPYQEPWKALNKMRVQPRCQVLDLDDEEIQVLWRNIQAGQWTLLPLKRGALPER